MELQNLRKAMDATTHKGKHFTEVQKNKIRKAVKADMNYNKKQNRYVMYGLTAVAVSILALLISTELMILPFNDGPFRGYNQVADNDWEERNEFKKNGEVLFSIYPDPDLSVGKPYGYMFSFTEPFEAFEGKELSIYARQKDSDERITLLPPKEITEPSLGYPSLERFTTYLEIPEGGLWRYEVYLDDQFYGDVVLSVDDSWKVTSKFTVKSEDRETVLRGVDGEVAFLDIMDFKVAQEGKTRWFFWGEELQEVNKDNFRLIGVHKETGKERVLIDSNSWEITNPKYENVEMKSVLGAQSSQHTVFSLPTTGLWRLDAYIGEKLYGSVVVEVHE